MGSLLANDWKAMDYESARKVLGNNFTGENFSELIAAFPENLRSANIFDKEIDGKKIYKPSIGRYNYQIINSTRSEPNS